MAQDVTLPDGQIASFPDEMDDAQITSILRRDFPQWGPKQTAESGIIGTLGGGFAQTGRAVGAAIDLAQGDTPELQAAAAEQAARVKDPRLSAFEADLAQRRAKLGADPGWLDVIGEVGSAAWKNPAGAGLMAVDQLPNSAAVLAGAGVGAAAGSMIPIPGVGTAAGGIIGGLAGMYAGNLAVEGGNRALEHVGKTGDLSSEDRSRLIYEGAIKAGVITGVDAATFGMTKFLTNAARRAVETATLRVAEQAGVTTAAEIAARRAADPAFDSAIMAAQKLAMDGATTFGKRALQTGAALGLETIGEGLGEYLGEFAATGEADKMDAVIEAFSSLGQSAAEVGIAKVWNSRNIIAPIAAAKTPDDAIAAADAALSAPIDTLSSAIDAFKSEWSAERVPADSALPMIGMPVDTSAPPALALPGQAAAPAQPLDVPRAPPGPALLALAEQVAAMAPAEQTKALMRLDAPMRQAVVRAMQPSGIVTPTVLNPGMGEAARITNEATMAASSVQPTGDAVVTNVPALTQRAAQEIVSKSSGMEMRPHREVAGRFEVVPVASTAGPGRAAPPTLQPPVGQQILADQESPAMPVAPAAPAVVTPAPLTAEQRAANQAAADAERSSQPRPIFGQNSQLRSETGPDIKGEKVTRNMRKVLAVMGRITGTKVIFEYAPDSAEGAVPKRGENTIHINTAADINPMQVMGHEVTHVLRDRHAAAWSKVRDALVATMPDKRKGLDDFAANYWGTPSNAEKLAAARAMPDWSARLTPEQKQALEIGEDTIEAFLLEEMVSDLGGKHWTDEKFWLDVFAKIEKAEGAKAKGIIERMVIAIRETLTKMLAVVRAQGQGDYVTISPEQIEKTRDAISSAYAEFIRAERRTEPDGEPHVTDHRIGTSDTHSRSSGTESEPQPAVPAQSDSGDELSDARASELASLSPSRPEREQRLFFEVAPNPNDASATAAWQKRTDAEKQAVSNDVVKRIIPGLLADLHVTGEVVTQLGGWKQYTNPSFALVVSKGDPALAARAIGYALDQEAVYALGLKSFTGGTKTGIIHFDIGRKDAHNIYKQVRDLARGIITGHSTVDGEMLIGLPMADMQRLRSAIIVVARKADVFVNFDEGYGAIIKEYGYGIRSGEQDTRQQHPTARDVNHWRTEAREVFGQQPDAAGSGSDRAGVVFSSDRPSYGTVRAGTGVSAVGVHYSQAERKTLSSRFFGTGMKGEERARIMHSNDERLKRRLYFYTNEGSGITPESGVGSHAHSVLLNNIYDIDADPDNLIRYADPNKDWRDQPIAPSLLMNYTEAAVIDAGYDGYMSHKFGRGGAVVLLGDHSVPVKYDGLGARPDVPVAPKAEPNDYIKQTARIAARKDLPAGQMTGAEWKRLVPDMDLSHLSDDKMYYKSALVATPIRRSESRPPAWWYSPLARQADAATMKKAPASGWKSWLKSLAAKGVKPDEIKWSGIEEWLDVQGEATVTREQVQAYLSEFGVRIETILRGERNPIRPVTDTEQEVDAEDADIELNVGDWQTDDPDDYYLAERAGERLEEEKENRIDAEYKDFVRIILTDLYETQNGRVMVDDYIDDVRRDAGDLFQLSAAEENLEARRRMAIDVVNEHWQEFADNPDITLDTGTEDAIETAMNRAFDVAMGDMEALETEARRRARAEIDEDKLLEELIEQERNWYYDDDDSPQTRQITVDGVDGTFYDSTSYGERNVYYDGQELTLPRRADDADVEGAIRQFVIEEGLVTGRSGDAGGYRAVKWEGYATDKSRAVPGSYREVQLTLPVGAFGLPKTRMREDAALNYYDDKGDLIGTTINEDRAKERADNMGGRVEPASPVQTARVTTSDFYYTTHWQEANVIGHARWDEHTDSDGKRVLVLQEVQGDWGQQRREGLEAQEAYEIALVARDTVQKRYDDAYDAVKATGVADSWRDHDWRDVAMSRDKIDWDSVSTEQAAAITELQAAYAAKEKAIREANEAEHKRNDLPDAAPFIEKTPQWAGLVLKRMIAHAIEYGFDKVVWTSGAQQVERWRSSLRQQVDTIAWEKTEDGIHIVASQRGRTRTDTRVSETALSDAIGKQMAKQIIADPNQSGEITGDDITISDTGMAGFYDRMLPTIANDILRKFDKDVRVKDIEVHEAPDKYEITDLSKQGGAGYGIVGRNRTFAGSQTYDTRDAAEFKAEAMNAADAATAIAVQQGFEITDKLRESAAAGMPLFSQRRASAEARLSHARKEWYRSQLSEAVGGLPAKIRTGKEAALWLTSNAGKLQVKKDELTWSGVLDWLQAQGKQPVTGAQIQDWLASNGVRVRTVMLGEESPEYKRLDAELYGMEEKIATLRKAAFGSTFDGIGVNPDIADIRDAAAGNVAASRVLANEYNPEQLDAMLAYGKALNRKNELFELRKAARGETPKHDSSSLRIPGGKPGTYRELLLVLPGTSKYKVVPHPDVTGSFAIQKPDGSYMLSGPDTVRPGTTLEWESEKMADEGMRFYAKDQFRSSHYPQPDILAHLRFEEMIDADGRRVMFIQEVQSDWGQKGRKEGFAGTERTAYQVVVDGNPAGAYESMAEAEAAKQRALKYNTPEKVEIRPVRGKVQDIKGIPAAPFVTDTKAWVALALKRAISHAVDNGFDRVAWTTGEQQNDRYDLSKQVSYIRAIRNSDDTYWVLAVQNREGRGGTGDVLFDKDKLTEAELENTIGKDLTQKIIKQEKRKEHEYTGLDLKVGGEGMVAFYDGIVKQVARSLGATVGTVSLPNPYRPSASGMTLAEADANLKKAEAAWKPTQAQPGFDITDKMREQAAIGMPLFSTKRKAVDTSSPEFKRWAKVSDIREYPEDNISYYEEGKGVVVKGYHGYNAARPFSEFKPLWKQHLDMPWLNIKPGGADYDYHQTAKAIPEAYYVARNEDVAYSYADQFESKGVHALWVRLENPVVAKSRDEAMDRMESNPAYDGAIFYDTDSAGRFAGVVYVVRTPTQLKSAISNTGEFSSTNPDIRRSERRALDRWLGKSKVRTVMYHGTARDISTFRPQQADAIFLTDDPEFAADFADLSHSWMLNNYWLWMTPEQIAAMKRTALDLLLKDTIPGSPLYLRETRYMDSSHTVSQYMRRAVEQFMPSESNIMPLYVRAENPFDYRNPEHVAAIEREIGTSWMGQEAINGEMHEVSQHIGDLERGDWNAIESEKVQAYIRANHDSFYVRERGVTNLAVFSPNQVKSASGNSGAYSREDNDIRRSEPRGRVPDDEMKRINMAQRHGEGLSVVPEDMFKRDTNPGVDYSGVFQTAAEHIGDLIHRLSYREDQGGGVGYGIEAALNKASRFVKPDSLSDALPQMKRNYEYYRDERGYKGSAEDFERDFRAAATRYAEAYKDMPYATLPQFLAKRAAVNLGNLEFSRVRANLRQLIDMLQGEQAEAHYWAPFVAGETARHSTPRSRMTGQPINQTWPDPDMTDWDDFVRKMQDKMVDTKRVIRAIREAGVAIAERFDPYMQEILYHGRAASRVKNFADTELRQLLEDMSMRGVVMQDLDDYLWARHAPERNAANARSNPAMQDGSGMTDAQAADILAGRAVTLNGRTIQLSAQTLRGAAALANRVDAINNRTLDLLVEYKLETQQTVDTWKRTYAHYTPLKRDMESDANYSGAFNLGLGTGQGFSVRGAASRRALGSKRSVTDVLANIAMQRERAIVRGEKNRVAQAVYGLALTAPNPEFWIPINPALNKGLSPAALAKLQAELVSIGVNPLDAQHIVSEPVERYIDPKTGLEATRINPRLRSRDDVLSVRINGEDRYVMFSNKERAQRMVAGLKNLDADQLGAFLQASAIGTRWFASVNTQFNPIFGITNGLRDLSTGMLNLSSTPLSANRAEIARNAFSALKGIYLDLRDHRAGRAPTSQWAQLFEQFALDGGQTGYRDMFQDSKARADEIAKELKHAGKGKQWVLGGEKHSAVFGWLSDYNTAVENAVRLSAYKAGLDRGMSRPAAAALAKNLTVNFNKKGLAATQTGALYAFFNAAVQGTARMAETMTTDGKLNGIGQKIVYGGIVLGVMQATLGMLAGWDDEEPPQYLREKNFLIPIPGSDKYISLPMPLGFHVIPSVGRIATEWMMSGFKDPGKRLVRLASVVLDAFNPVGGNSSVGQMLSPTITDPIIALGENQDWTGKPIYKEDFSKMQPTPGWTRTKDSASPPSRWISYALNYVTGGGKYEIGLASPTPDQIDYLVGQATGGVGRELLKTAQFVGAKATGEELPLYKTPLGVGRFVGETKGQASETSRFYDNLRRIGEHKSALEEMKDAGDRDALLRYTEKNPDARLVQTADKAQREIGYLRRQKRELIEKGANKERIKMIEDKITGLTGRYNEVLGGRK